MSESMVERVASRLYGQYQSMRPKVLDFQPWSDLPAEQQDHWRGYARAAVAEMRDASFAMQMAGLLKVELNIGCIYQAMIDEALA